MFATVLSRTEPAERFLDAALVVVDNVLFDRRLELLVAVVNTPIVKAIMRIPLSHKPINKIPLKKL